LVSILYYMVRFTMLVLLVFSLNGCFLFIPHVAKTPTVESDTNQKINKYNVSVGVIIPKDMANQKYYYEDSTGGEVTINIGESTANLFTKALSGYFRELVVIDGSIKNNNKHCDMLLYPTISSVSASRSDNHEDGELRHWKHATIAYTVTIKDAQDKIINTITITGQGADYWADSPKILLMGSALTDKVYSSAFSKALQNALQELLSELKPATNYILNSR